MHSTEPLILRYFRHDGGLTEEEEKAAIAIVTPIYSHISFHSAQIIYGCAETEHLYRDCSMPGERRAWFFVEDADRAYHPHIVKCLDWFHLGRLRQARSIPDVLVCMEEIKGNERFSPEVRECLLSNARFYLNEEPWAYNDPLSAPFPDHP